MSLGLKTARGVLIYSKRRRKRCSCKSDAVVGFFAASLLINLARRTIECRTATLDDAFDLTVTASSRAGLALAIVSGKHFLKIAEFAIRLPMIAQRRTTGSH